MQGNYEEAMSIMQSHEDEHLREMIEELRATSDEDFDNQEEKEISVQEEEIEESGGYGFPEDEELGVTV